MVDQISLREAFYRHMQQRLKKWYFCQVNYSVQYTYPGNMMDFPYRVILKLDHWLRFHQKYTVIPDIVAPQYESKLIEAVLDVEEGLMDILDSYGDNSNATVRDKLISYLDNDHTWKVAFVLTTPNKRVVVARIKLIPLEGVNHDL